MDSGIVTKWSRPPPRFPWLTLTLFLSCVGIKLFQLGMPPMAQNAMLELGGVLPLQLNDLMQHPSAGWFDYQFLTLFSALFIHASWLHLLGNMVLSVGFWNTP